MKKMAFSMIFTADIVPIESNYYAFNSGRIEEIVDKYILDILASADFRFMNLEVPLTDEVNPIDKCGPNLIAPTSTIKGLKAFNPTVFGLANNHILDQGEGGLLSTLKVLEENGIDYTGAGRNLSEAWKPYIYEKDGVKVGIYACAEHEFTLATEDRGGANPFDPFESLDHIAGLKQECDYVVVVYHGGKEHYRYPSPYLRKAMRKIIEKGADLVMCQHTHCISCTEEYCGGTILYGQGNFLFDHSELEEWQTGLIVKVTIDGGMKVEYIPFHKDGEKVRKPTPEEEKEIMDGFAKRTEQIKDNNFVKENYQKFCMEMAPEYFRRILGMTKEEMEEDIKQGCKYSIGRFDIPKLMCLRNYHECEPHNELIVTAIDVIADKLRADKKRK
jgi:poly-gamma-glutamate capsule biosynthesis protein CapA/YwtB (metallophosphatase superfamily)